jgi:hypothetical protein
MHGHAKVLLQPLPLLQVLANETYASFNPRQLPDVKLLSYVGSIDPSGSTPSGRVVQVSVGALCAMMATASCCTWHALS